MRIAVQGTVRSMVVIITVTGTVKGMVRITVSSYYLF